jgi:nucleotidyltransferase substrate binding protein (TIGR01987 family)
VERLRERLTLARQAVATLREVALLGAPNPVQRDAAIQRFEYSFEATWKAAQRLLRVVEGMEVGSPKAAIRASRETGLLDVALAEQALTMADDRNLTAHTYNEALARAIFGRLPGHLEVLERWLAALESRAGGGRPR